ncbi:MAG: ceramidase domain-containing protein [Myxococcaceae bacterium]|nr:ceramidase domain-containing protein [Myxococcaceae bacterium]
MRRRHATLGWTLAATAAGLAALVAFALLGWPGEPIDCTSLLCYCEAPVAGLWRQPVNTWSNVVPLIAAVAVAHDAGRTTTVPLPRALGLVFALTLVFQGLGSMFFHASLTAWSGAVDAMSMFMVVGMLSAVNLYRLRRLGERALVPFWLTFSVGGAVLGLVAPAVTGNLVMVVAVSMMASEVYLHRRDATLPKKWFRAGMLVFGVGVVVWHFSAIEGMPLCAPESVWQGHALWHITSAAAVAMFWLHARENFEHVAAR